VLWVSDKSDCEHHRVLGCNTLSFDRNLPAFLSDVLLSSSVYNRERLEVTAVKMEAVLLFEASVDCYQTARPDIAEVSSIHSLVCEVHKAPS
jgi:hypothetical protein